MRRYLLALTSPPPPLSPGWLLATIPPSLWMDQAPWSRQGSECLGENPRLGEMLTQGVGEFPVFTQLPRERRREGTRCPPPDRTEAILDASRRAVLLPEPLSRCPRLGALSRSP